MLQKKVALLCIFIALSTNLESCGPSQEELNDQATLTAEAQVVTRTHSFIETETARPTMTLTITPTHTITPTETPMPHKHPLLSDLQMVSPQIGWALDAEDSGNIFRTEDGGETWVLSTRSHFSLAGAKIQAIDEDTALYSFGIFDLIAGDRPSDIIADLKEVIHSSAEVANLEWHALDENNIWMSMHVALRAGGAVAIYRTSDGGVSWKQILRDYDGAFWIWEIMMVDETNGWLSAFKDKQTMPPKHERYWVIYRTVDGGHTWSPKQLPPPSDALTEQANYCYSKLHQIDNPTILQIIVTCFDNGDQAIGRWYFKSPISGNNWRSWLMEGAVYFIDVNTGWRLINQDDGSAIIESTKDGGHSWVEMGIAPGQGANWNWDKLKGHYMSNGGPDPRQGGFQFWNETDGYIISAEGQDTILWVTSDGGITWEEKGTFSAGVSITFLDRNHGWAYEDSDLWRTEDGGETWQELSPIIVEKDLPSSSGTALSLDFELTSIHMINETDGWGLQGSSVWTTRDGGRTWSGVTPPELQDEEKRLGAYGGFADTNHAWILFTYEQTVPDSTCSSIKSNASIWYTTDGGQTWDISQTFNTNLAYYCDVSFEMTDTHTGLMRIENQVAGDYLFVLYYITTDGGESWNLSNQSGCMDECIVDFASHRSSWDMEFSDSKNGWLLNWTTELGAPRYYITSDGGTEWTERELPAPSSAPDLFTQWGFCLPSQLNLLSENAAALKVSCFQKHIREETRSTEYLYITEDGGINWSTHELPKLPFFVTDEFNLEDTWTRMIFFDRYHGLLLGQEMWRTEDGGATWDRINTVTWYGQFSFVNPWNGWAIAKSGAETALVYTTNGGETWKVLNPGISE